jgi:hypothetical protein
MPEVNFVQEVEEVLGPYVRVFKAHSKSRAGLFHIVVVVEGERGLEYICTCEGQNFNRKCWHVDAARDKLNDQEEFDVSL